MAELKQTRSQFVCKHDLLNRLEAFARSQLLPIFKSKKYEFFKSEIWAFRVILGGHFPIVMKNLPSIQLHLYAFFRGICLTGNEFLTIFSFSEGSIFRKPEVKNFHFNVIKIVSITITTAPHKKIVQILDIKKMQNYM